ncbi:MAG TPA: hypothetical protein VLG16_05055 [Candidatus Saccharimonadales bacterium]|nr:hypothetical protein [Candidatus Saccharimonadales bacterium]
MFVTEIEAIKDLLPLYEKHDDTAHAELVNQGAAFEGQFDSQLDRLIAHQNELDSQQEQANLNAQFLANFRLLLPQPVKGVMVAKSDDELLRISKNVIWNRESPAYLIGRRATSAKKRFGRVLLDHTIKYSTGSEGLGVVRLHNGDVNRFLRGQVSADKLDAPTAQKLFNPKTQQYNLSAGSALSIRLGSTLFFKERNVIRESELITYKTSQHYVHGKKDEDGTHDYIPAIPDADLRDYEVMHHIARLAANFGLISELGNLLEERKQTALQV